MAIRYLVICKCLFYSIAQLKLDTRTRASGQDLTYFFKYTRELAASARTSLW